MIVLRWVNDEWWRVKDENRSERRGLRSKWQKIWGSQVGRSHVQSRAMRWTEAMTKEESEIIISRGGGWLVGKRHVKDASRTSHQEPLVKADLCR